MKRKIITLAIGLVLVATVAGSALAMPERSTFHLTTLGTQKTLILPSSADHSPVISLGAAVDPTSGKVVEGYAIVHYVKGGGGGGKPGGGSTCYAFLASGAKWKTVEDWLMNPANASSLDGTTLFNDEAADISKWEDAADGAMGGGSINILGNGTETTDSLFADLVAPDGLNEAYFADVSGQGAIAVTIVWGIFGGPPQGRALTEWDQVYDDVDYTWSASGEAGKMDFENISTHELGHSVGLSDLYNTGCSEQTMYGYATYGEIKKQSLESGDIAGISKLY
ncbi:MAG: matrixin family metalloprotease [bacterium]